MALVHLLVRNPSMVDNHCWLQPTTLVDRPGLPKIMAAQLPINSIVTLPLFSRVTPLIVLLKELI